MGAPHIEPLSTGNLLSLIFNVLLHAIILFAIWTVLFSVLIGPIEKDALKGSLASIIDGVVGTNVNTIPADVKTQIKTALDSDYAARLETYLGAETEATKIQNGWISAISIAVPALGAVLLAFMLFILTVCKVRLPVGHIFVENLITFILVGIVELALFENIAVHYVPVTISTITNTVITAARSGLNCPATS